MMVKQAGVGAKGVAKSPALVWRGASIGLISFFFVVGPFCGTPCTHADWHTLGPQNELSLGCDAVSGFQRVGADWMSSPLFLWGCGASASCTWKMGPSLGCQMGDLG